MTKLLSIHLEFFIAIYHSYQLLYCEGHIQMMSSDSIIHVETKAVERQNCIQYTKSLHCNIYHLQTVIL